MYKPDNLCGEGKLLRAAESVEALRISRAYCAGPIRSLFSVHTTRASGWLSRCARTTIHLLFHRAEPAGRIHGYCPNSG
jgi:hypothetical protein